MAKNTNHFFYVMASTVIPVALLAVIVTTVYFLTAAAQEGIRAAKREIASIGETYIKGGTGAGDRQMALFDKDAASRAESIEALLTARKQREAEAIFRAEAQLDRLHSFSWMGGSLAVLASILAVGVSLNFMARKAHLSIIELTKCSRLLSSIAEVTADAATQISGGTHSQAAAIEESSSQLEEITDRSTRTSSRYQEIAKTADNVKKGAERGKFATEKLDSAISRIKCSSDDMARIVRTIDEIAFQTNLLSLNAAVEAARAGEAGAGFAVVADEVRNLALRSATAAAQTAELIEEAQKNAGNGVFVAKEVGSLLGEIIHGVDGVTHRITEISEDIEDQTRNIGQISTAIESIGNVMQTNAELADRFSNSCRHMSGQVKTLNIIVDNLTRGFGTSLRAELVKKFSAGNTNECSSKCWEVKQCGRIPGGANEREMGICPAYPEHGLDCWNIGGTFCGGKVQGSAAQKLLSCKECGFYQDMTARA